MNKVTDDKIKKVFARNLVAVMDACGITQAELSRKTGESEARLSSYRKALKIPSIGVVTRIAEALGTTVENLITEKKLSKTA